MNLTELQRLADLASPMPWDTSPSDVPYVCRKAFKDTFDPDTAKKLIAVAEVLELVRDLASQEWQQADGKRMGATDNQGRRMWFITEDVMQAARTALEELN